MPKTTSGPKAIANAWKKKGLQQVCAGVCPKRARNSAQPFWCSSSITAKFARSNAETQMASSVI
jgi:hypothetical protein